MTAVYPLPPEAIVEQVRAVVEDIGVDAVKIGMVGIAEAIEAVVEALDLLRSVPVVLDPVMVAESGGRLLEPTPSGRCASGSCRGSRSSRPTWWRRPRWAAWTWTPTPGRPRARGARARPGAVVVTGGHREPGDDLFFDGERLVEIPGSATPTGRRTARAAPTRRRSPRSWRWGSSRWRRRAGPRDGRAPRCATGCAARRGPGPVDVLGVAPARAPTRPAARAFVIIARLAGTRRRHRFHLRSPTSSSFA